MTSQQRLIEAAEKHGWEWRITRPSRTLIMKREGVTVWVSFTADGKVRSGLFETPDGADRINGGVPAIIDELRRFGK